MSGGSTVVHEQENRDSFFFRPLDKTNQHTKAEARIWKAKATGFMCPPFDKETTLGSPVARRSRNIGTFVLFIFLFLFFYFIFFSVRVSFVT